MKSALVICISLLSISLTVQADYVEVVRNANIYEEANSSSQKVKKALRGETYILVLTDQKNGYFNIAIPNSNRTGWVYRTLVRRYPGLPDGYEHIAIEEEVKVHIIDVGAGLGTVIELPENKWVIYDAGHYRGGSDTRYHQFETILPENAEIELMVLSHTDGDHIGAAGEILRKHKVRKLLWTGYEKSMISSSEPTASFTRITEALSEIDYNIDNINLNQRDSTITPGIQLKYGEVTLTFLCGFGEPESTWDLNSNGERLNSVSIVMKLEYEGKSILFCGDAVGRHIGDPDNSIIATEAYMVQNAKDWLDSDIIIAPHHGADNGSSTEFISLVSPESVIFSSGSYHNHPTRSAAERYLRSVDINNIYRTDRGDDEEKPDKPYYEWRHGQIDGCTDGYGDDDIQITLHPSSSYTITYLNPNPPCN